MTNNHESEANYFARCLLIPEDLLRHEVKALGPIDLANDKRVAELSKRFQVPTAVMVIRLSEVFNTL